MSSILRYIKWHAWLQIHRYTYLFKNLWGISPKLYWCHKLGDIILTGINGGIYKSYLRGVPFLSQETEISVNATSLETNVYYMLMSKTLVLLFRYLIDPVNLNSCAVPHVSYKITETIFLCDIIKSQKFWNDDHFNRQWIKDPVMTR